MLKKQPKKKNEDNINYKKLFFELMIILAVIFAGAVCILLPVLKEHGAFEDHSNDIFDEVIKEMDNYDVSKGRDLAAEERLNEGWHDTKNLNKKFYYGIALATYYCKIGHFKTADAIFEKLYENIPTSRDNARNVLEVHDVICDRKMREEGYK